MKNRDVLAGGEKEGALRRILLLAIIGAISLLGLIGAASAEPTGATVTNVSWSTKNTSSPQMRNDSRGTITTLRLDAVQQDYKWKAYVGNVSSTFTLSDSADYSIYRWTLDSFTGQIYITRNNSVTWTSVNCVNSTSPNQKLGEDTILYHNSMAADSINRTFSQQVHRPFNVGTRSIPANCSFSSSTNMNNVANPLNQTSYFQELLLSDGSSLIYATFVENDRIGYRADGTTYDFQAIVADDADMGHSQVPYYFFLELS